MNPQETQGIDVDKMKGEFGDTKASLAFSNMLREGMFSSETGAQVPVEDEEQMSADPEAEAVEEEAPASPTNDLEIGMEEPVEESLAEEPEEEESQVDILAELEAFKKEMSKEFKKEIKKEIGGIKDMIAEIADEDEEETPTKASQPVK